MIEEKIYSKLVSMIKEFTKSQSDVKGQILISYPSGIPVADTWDEKIDPILVGALSAAVKLTFRKLCTSFKKGNLKRLLMRSDYGRVIIQNTGPNAILTTIVDDEADIFRIAFSMNNLIISIRNYLEETKADFGV